MSKISEEEARQLIKRALSQTASDRIADPTESPDFSRIFEKYAEKLAEHKDGIIHDTIMREATEALVKSMRHRKWIDSKSKKSTALR